MDVIASDIRRREFKPVYLLYGEEGFLRDRRARELADAVVDKDLADFASATARRAFRIPESLISRISLNNPADPILLQFFPRHDEILPIPGFVDDPLHETDNSEVDAPTFILQKYQGRVLVLTTEYCPAACRYCFRRGEPDRRALFLNSSEYPREKIDQCLQFLKKDPSIHEIILSGGDPLSLADQPLKLFLNELTSADQLKRIRIHTRLPILIPTRIDDSFLDLFKDGLLERMACFIVFQINHSAEINNEVRLMFRRLRQNGLTLFSQTVLLRGVNDSADTLAELFEELGNNGVIPYYLHQLDRVAGAAHFEVPEEKGRAIRKEFQRRLSGFLVPKYVREIPGTTSKNEL